MDQGMIDSVKNAIEHEDTDQTVVDLLISWRKLATALAKIEALITIHLLEKKESLTVGNATAKYSAGRRELDYEANLALIPPEIIEKHTTVTGIIDMRSIIGELQPPQELIEKHTEYTKHIDIREAHKEAGIEPAVAKEGTPKVTFELKK